MKLFLTTICLVVSAYLFAQRQNVATFKDCALGDSFYLEFEGIAVDFSQGVNNYSGYDLCIEDEDGYTIPNPVYIGQEFIITWSKRRTEIIPDPTEPWKRERVMVPYIESLQLITEENGLRGIADFLGHWGYESGAEGIAIFNIKVYNGKLNVYVPTPNSDITTMWVQYFNGTITLEVIQNGVSYSHILTIENGKLKDTHGKNITWYRIT